MNRTGKLTKRYIHFVILLFSFFVADTSAGDDHTGGDVRKLNACPENPNCVCSEYNDDSHFIEPFNFNKEPLVIWKKLKLMIGELGGKIEEMDNQYLHATFTSIIFGFVDDAEFRMDEKRKLIHVRSSSRTGYYDFGVNRKRINDLRKKMSF